MRNKNRYSLRECNILMEKIGLIDKSKPLSGKTLERG